MTDQLRKRWMVAGVLWGAALLLAYINFLMIQNISRQREHMEAMRLDAAFVENNLHEIEKMLHHQTAYRQPVDSVQIGCLTLKNRLRNLASAHHLAVMELESDSEQALADSIPIRLSFVGAYPDALSMLTALERDYRYAPAVQLRISQERVLLTPRFDMRLSYHFELAGTQAVE